MTSIMIMRNNKNKKKNMTYFGVLIIIVSILLLLPSSSLLLFVHGYTIIPSSSIMRSNTMLIQKSKSSSRLILEMTKTNNSNNNNNNSNNNQYNNKDKILLLEKQLEKCTTGTQARQLLSQTLYNNNDNDDNNISTTTSATTTVNIQPKQKKSKPLYNSIQIPINASTRPISNADLAIQTNIRNTKYSIMELIDLNGDKDIDRASLGLLCVFIGSTFTALSIQSGGGGGGGGGGFIQFVLSWIFSFLPFLYIGLGLSIPNELYTILISIQRTFLPIYKKRMIHHEAGHFLIGHLLGLPIKGYRVNNVVKNAVEFYPLRDDDVGKVKATLLGFDNNRRVDNNNDVGNYDADRTTTTTTTGGYFDKGGRGEEVIMSQSVFRNQKNYTDNPFLKIDIQNDIKQSWPYRGFDQGTIDKLAAISVAGICSEILSFGNAEGGYADLGQLKQILNNADSELNEKEKENIIRYSIGYTMGLLRQHLGALDTLIEVMDRDGSVAECIIAIESCENVSGATVMGNYENIRRKEIQEKDLGIIERLALGGKNANVVDDNIIYGKGGGDRKQGFQLTGDDPLYAALATAMLFLVWASGGGLSLH